MSARDAALRALAAANVEGARIFKSVLRSATLASRQSGSTLAGGIGGFVGMGAAYALTFVAPISFPVVSVILSCIGIVGGVMLYRGRRRREFRGRR